MSCCGNNGETKCIHDVMGHENNSKPSAAERLKDKANGVKHISALKFTQGDFLTLMQFAWCADQEAFQKAFGDIGIQIDDEDDLNTLYQLYKSGGDKVGELKNPSTGNPIKFSVLDTFGKINVDNRKVDNCGIKFTDIEKI